MRIDTGRINSYVSYFSRNTNATLGNADHFEIDDEVSISLEASLNFETLTPINPQPVNDNVLPPPLP